MRDCNLTLGALLTMTKDTEDSKKGHVTHVNTNCALRKASTRNLKLRHRKKPQCEADGGLKLTLRYNNSKEKFFGQATLSAFAFKWIEAAVKYSF